jgi:hypothetical protein
MSSSNNNDSLSALANRATAVSTVLMACARKRRMGKPVSLKTFVWLQSQINQLQTACPNHKGVLAARVDWFWMATASLQSCVVENEENSDWPYRNLPEPEEKCVSGKPNYLLCSAATLMSFLKRSYLKDNFASLFRQVRELFERVVEVDGIPDEARIYFLTQLQALDENLLHGQL